LKIGWMQLQKIFLVRDHKTVADSVCHLLKLTVSVHVKYYGLCSETLSVLYFCRRHILLDNGLSNTWDWDFSKVFWKNVESFLPPAYIYFCFTKPIVQVFVILQLKNNIHVYCTQITYWLIGILGQAYEDNIYT
jgi:hypothetical protein